MPDLGNARAPVLAPQKLSTAIVVPARKTRAYSTRKATNIHRSDLSRSLYSSVTDWMRPLESDDVLEFALSPAPRASSSRVELSPRTRTSGPSRKPLKSALALSWIQVRASSMFVSLEKTRQVKNV